MLPFAWARQPTGGHPLEFPTPLPVRVLIVLDAGRTDHELIADDRAAHEAWAELEFIAGLGHESYHVSSRDGDDELVWAQVDACWIIQTRGSGQFGRQSLVRLAQAAIDRLRGTGE